MIKFTQWPKISILPLAEKKKNWIENGWHPLGRARRALPPCKDWGRSNSAPAVGAKIWRLYVCFFVTLRGRRAVRSTGVDYTLSRFCVAVCGSTLKQLRTVTTTVCDGCYIVLLFDVLFLFVLESKECSLVVHWTIVTQTHATWFQHCCFKGKGKVCNTPTVV